MTIPYELAKELRDAGFPEPDDWTNKYAYCLTSEHDWEHAGCREEAQLIHDDNDEGRLVGKDYSHRFKENTWLYAPTLEELIEACGNKFYNLKQDSNGKWLATGNISQIDTELVVDGEYEDTPEIALARLWLAINKH